MKHVLIAMLLVGCAVGQNSTVCLNKHIGSKGLTDVERCFLSHPGDCYRVKQDGTLEKMDYCGMGLVDTFQLTSESVDVPAVQPHNITQERIHACTLIWGDRAGMYVSVDYDKCVMQAECSDPNRILIGPDGRGQYFCHLPQVQP